MEFPLEPTPHQLAQLKTGSEILRERVAKEAELMALSVARQKAAQEEEAGRKEKALLQFKEDRIRKKEQDERDRAARARRAAVPDVPVSPTSPEAKQV